MSITIRYAEPRDLAAITEIYDEAVRTTTGTFDTEPRSDADQLAWYQAHRVRYPLIVADFGGTVVALSEMRQAGTHRGVILVTMFRIPG